MSRRKNDSVKWTLVLVLVVFSQYVYSRPQIETTTLDVSVDNLKSTESTPRINENEMNTKTDEVKSVENKARDVKDKSPGIGESIKKVATQLLDKSNQSTTLAAVPDTRIPPKLKTQIAQKQKIKTRKEDSEESFENSHVGVAVPVTMDEIELEIKEISNESSTTNEGISTWILLSNPVNKDSISISTEATKTEDVPKKQKPVTNKTKTKKPQNKTQIAKRPIIGSTNKADLIAGGSALNENVYNKIKDTVLSNVQKNKSSPNRSTTLSTSTLPTSTEAATTKLTVSIATTTAKAKPVKKNNKNKIKSSTTTTTLVVPISSESALLPVEPKEQEIELEISTPATITKQPKRSSNKKKTKTKKRKTTKPKTESTTAVTEVKTEKIANKTKLNKTTKKPSVSAGQFGTQIYNYFSREVMPSVGVGVIGLAGLVGIASYFLYPFASPVRRVFEVDKKDDIYRHNGEEYASEGNGQPEEEMLGTVLAGMPVHAKQTFNPYAGQMSYINRYPAKKDQDIRYRHVASNYDPNRNVHFPQQKTGIAHGAVYPDSKQKTGIAHGSIYSDPQQKTGIAHGAIYPEPINYNHHYQHQTRHAYTTEKKYEKAQTYATYPAVEPIYAAPQTGPSGISSYGSDTSGSVVYGVKPSDDTDFKPVYPYDTHIYSEPTSSPVTYSPTSMYLGSNNEGEETVDEKYSEESNTDMETVDNKFVVGNVPKELTESATPVVVPEHGPRNLKRRRRNVRRKRSVVGSIEEILKAAKENKENEIFISNEIDDGLGVPISPSPVAMQSIKNNEQITPGTKDVFTVYAVSMDPSKEQPTDMPTVVKSEVIESVSTLPVEDKKQNLEKDMSNELDGTTNTFKIYEVFPTTKIEDASSPLIQDSKAKDSTVNDMNTETTTEFKSEVTSTVPPTPNRPKPTYEPEVITYPPLTNGGIFDFIKRLVEFKYRLGLSILQTTSESLSRYLRNLDHKLK